MKLFNQRCFYSEGLFNQQWTNVPFGMIPIRRMMFSWSNVAMILTSRQNWWRASDAFWLWSTLTATGQSGDSSLVKLPTSSIASLSVNTISQSARPRSWPGSDARLAADDETPPSPRRHRRPQLFLPWGSYVPSDGRSPSTRCILSSTRWLTARWTTATRSCTALQRMLFGVCKPYWTSVVYKISMQSLVLR